MLSLQWNDSVFVCVCSYLRLEDGKYINVSQLTKALKKNVINKTYTCFGPEYELSFEYHMRKEEIIPESKSDHQRSGKRKNMSSDVYAKKSMEYDSMEFDETSNNEVIKEISNHDFFINPKKKTNNVWF